MNKFTEGKSLCARVTPPVIVTEQDHVNARKIYTESLEKKQKRLKSIKYYKKDLSFQNLFSYLVFLYLFFVCKTSNMKCLYVPLYCKNNFTIVSHGILGKNMMFRERKGINCYYFVALLAQNSIQN